MDDRPLCRLCSLDNADGDELLISIAAFVSAIPDGERTGSEAYIARLTACSSCAYLNGYTCAKCGCFVQVRAAKARMDCPLPCGSRWH